jgi:hypothetical protein
MAGSLKALVPLVAAVLVLAATRSADAERGRAERERAVASTDGWKTMLRTRTDLLNGIDGLAGSDMWVAGAHRIKAPSGDGYLFFPLLERWDGAHWHRLRLLMSLPLRQGWFNAVTENDGDVWAVGATWSSDLDESSSLIAHFDGTTWKTVSVPSLPGRFSTLDAITAIAPDDVWVLGTAVAQSFEYVGKPQRLFTGHWDGARWSFMKLPVAAASVAISDVDASGSRDVWAVGSLSDSSTSNELDPISVHWNGRHWTAIRPETKRGVGRRSCRASTSSPGTTSGPSAIRSSATPATRSHRPSSTGRGRSGNSQGFVRPAAHSPMSTVTSKAACGRSASGT